MTNIPKDHPRYHSLVTREKISEGLKKGLVHETGLIAHGRGEAFDYLIGEKTIDIADDAAKVAAACLLIAEHPVISVNGNVVALVCKEIISLSKIVPASIEVNLFHRTNERLGRLSSELKKNGGNKIFGLTGDGRIPGLSHDRGICDREGIFNSDVVLVPLEDGDRCQALKKMGKTVITIDLNPLSRTSKTADVTVVDNVIRAVPNIERWVKKLRDKDRKVLREMVDSWDNTKMLRDVLDFVSKRLNQIY